MGALQTAEKQLRGLFKGMPPLPKQSKDGLVKAWPIIAIVFGVLQVAAAYWLFQATRVVEAYNELVNSLSAYYTGSEVGLSSMDRTVMYLGVALLLVDGVILLMAYPHLQKRTRRGWDLLFLAALINAVYAVVSAFMAQRGGAGSLLFGLLSSAAGFYLLFQVKDHYAGRALHTTAQ